MEEPKDIDELTALKEKLAEAEQKNNIVTEKLVAACWREIDGDIGILIEKGEDPLYILRVLLDIVRDKKEGEA